MEEENKSIKEVINELSSKLDSLVEQKKAKEWKLPWSARTGMGTKKKRKGYIVVMNIGLNKAVSFYKVPIQEGVIDVDGTPHVVRPDDILLWKNKIPMIVQPEWSEKPFKVRESVEETIANNEGTEGYKFIMNYLLRSQITQKKSIPVGYIIFGVIAIVGLGYYLLKSGALN